MNKTSKQISRNAVAASIIPWPQSQPETNGEQKCNQKEVNRT